MGGRKDDVTRTTKQNRNRPLSAVIEEFEVDDHDLKHIINKDDDDDVREGGEEENEDDNDNAIKTNSDECGVAPKVLDRTSAGNKTQHVNRGRSSVRTSAGVRAKKGSSLCTANDLTSTVVRSREHCASCSLPAPLLSSVSVASSSLTPPLSSSSSTPANTLTHKKWWHSSSCATGPSISLASTQTTMCPSWHAGSPLPSPSVAVLGSLPPLSASSSSPSSVPASAASQIPLLSVTACDCDENKGPTIDGVSDASPTTTTTNNNNNINNNNVSPSFPRRPSLRSRRQVPTISHLNLSPKLSRRGSYGRRSFGSDIIQDGDDDTLSASDMARLRQMTERLRLSTRRPSTMQWRAQFVECPQFPAGWTAGKRGSDVIEDLNGGCIDLEEERKDTSEKWTEERTQRINTALDWIKNELLEMRAQDQNLARQLLSIRSDLHQLKLARSCEEHQDMLDDVQQELEDLQEFADVLDLPTPTIADSPLKHLGVTRMNLSARRFSTC